MASIQSVSATSATGAATAAASSTANGSEIQDRFLKLLVTQMKNQDPLNPLDNAQVTSQLAQINTVNGIEKLAGAQWRLHRPAVGSHEVRILIRF